MLRQPLFLYVPFQSVHNPMEAPASYVDKYKHIHNKTRRIYAGKSEEGSAKG